MSKFNEWDDDREGINYGAINAQVYLMIQKEKKAAYNAGMERAAEIATEHAADGPYYIAHDLGIKIADAIRSEMEER